MKKSVLTILVLILALSTTAWAQMDSKVETGIIAFQAGDYKKALDFLNEGLKDKSQLKEKNVPRAYYHRGLARLQVMALEGKKMAESNAEPTEEQAKALMDMLFGAYDDFKQAKVTDDGKWGKKVDVELTKLNFAFWQAGIKALNVSYDAKLSQAEREAASKQVAELMNYSVEIDSKNYFPFDLRAQGKLGIRDSAGAWADFNTAAQLVEANTHTNPDLQVAYIYYRKAILERYHKHSLNDALATLDRGKTILDKEWEKVKAKKAEAKPEAFAKDEKTYLAAKEDLNKFELDLLLNAPEKLQEAINKFKDAIVKEPNNYILHVAYAQLLEKVGKGEEAAGIYEKATQIDPSKQMAWFNLGAMYVNQAVALYKEANTISDDAGKAKALQNQGDDLFKKALPYLQKSNEIDKCDGETLRALLQLTVNLQMMDEYKKYKDIEKSCKEGQ